MPAAIVVCVKEAGSEEEELRLRNKSSHILP